MLWTGEIVSVSHTRRRLQALFALTYAIVALLLGVAGIMIALGDSQVARWFLSSFSLPLHPGVSVYGGLMTVGALCLVWRTWAAWRRKSIVSLRAVRWCTLPFVVHIIGTVLYSTFANASVGGWLATSIYVLAYILLNALAMLNPLVNRLMR